MNIEMKLSRALWVVTLFAIAMAFLESAVVIYLREILYPDGFQFPLAPVPVELALTELLREAATLVMLVTIGILAGRSFSSGFAWFLYSFAVWDIFYYVFLKLLVGWPESLLTWDVLFLIPTTWTGPVLAPVLVSMTMILLAMVILTSSEKGRKTKVLTIEWAGLILGSLVLIAGFVYDYTEHMLAHFSLPGMFQIENPEVLEVATRYIPHRFPWWIFIIGEWMIVTMILIYYRRVQRQ